ncbi:two-component system response regulator KdpE [Xenorhabdus hominickii]|uniref:Two-component system response regulator KdpE n=1 Tax=Xenorhabdus hominickii TaxID=351679 RepID=A0ABN4SE02_XENHO|nr:two-component system response regulator KdpE [Xenorhabdus hominickii]AOM42850.1 two-component system response regulator KdpE [Xenorhabdus hominickii]
MHTIKNNTVLIIEDEKEIRRFVRLALEGENSRVFECDTLKRGLIEAATRKPDLLILDLGLPDGNGIDLIHDIRQWSNIPIIVLSARDSEQDKVMALDCGADDYLSKPFGINELIARVRVALRRSSKTTHSESVIHFSNIQVDLVNRRVLKGNDEIHLTPIEYRLLTEFLTNSGKVLTQRYLLSHVWGPNYVEHNHYLRIYMGHLRQKLEDEPARPKHLLTETAVGYRFMP